MTAKAIGISGGSCSGKSTLTRKIFDRLGPDQCVILPQYDFPTHMPKTETERTESRPVILIDGILILQHQPLRDLLDLSIFVECDAETRFARRLERDVRERGRSARSVHDQFADARSPRRAVQNPRRYRDKFATVRNDILDAAGQHRLANKPLKNIN